MLIIWVTDNQDVWMANPNMYGIQMVFMLPM